MAITHLSNWRAELASLREQMDRLWNDVGNLLHHESQLQPFAKDANALWGPSIELRETATEVILKAQIPGVNAEDLDVQVTDHAVSIAGEHRSEEKSEANGYYQSEFQYGRFQRIIPLPVRIQQEDVKSEFKQGVLTLTLPKAMGADRPVTKVDIQAVARAQQTESRQSEAHIQETAEMRTEQVVAETGCSLNAPLDEAAREEMAAQRQAEHEREEKMLERVLTG